MVLFSETLGRDFTLQLADTAPVIIAQNREQKRHQRIGAGHDGTGEVHKRWSPAVGDENIIQLVQVTVGQSPTVQVLYKLGKQIEEVGGNLRWIDLEYATRGYVL